MPRTTASIARSRKSNKHVTGVPDSDLRCTHTDTLGRRCRSLALNTVKGANSNSTSGLCPAHATEDRLSREAEEVANYLFNGTPDLRTAAAVNHVLGRLFILIGRNKIPLRTASHMAYVASLLLQSLSGVRYEVTNAWDDHAMDRIFRRSFEILDAKLKAEADRKSKSVEGNAQDSDDETESEPVQ